ncbi:hypothetical protein EVJ58_g4317 [Rhodofomes roseus]|uniref:Ubiquitin-like protease family profile domain-containing protein n=1 Tax=Rhodofomes roseus TaxID=34475 RepID=A0A4Y9YHX9_9APHY|nr:hypothetical protein EVJ58_g4317 [Rhodofomes roseus]
MQNHDVVIEIHDELPTVWVESEWIRAGKKYPSSDTPQCVLDARRHVLAIPPQYSNYLHGETTSVLLLLATSLPPQPSILVAPQAEPAPTSDDYFTPAPSRLWSGMVRRGAVDCGLALQRLACSAIHADVLVGDGEGSQAADHLARAEEWLTRWGRGIVKEVDEARDGLAMIPWGVDYRALNAVGTIIDVLATFLSDDWLSDEHINMFATHLANRVRRKPALAKSVVVAGLAFAREIEAAACMKPCDYKLSSFLRDYKELFTLHGRKRLLFPVYVVTARHWVAVEVNFQTNSISYGDSMESISTAPQKAIKALQKWLQREFGRKFTDRGNTLLHGQQKDTSSCGICTINTIAHALFGDDLFTHKTRQKLRVEYFNIAVRAYTDLTTAESQSHNNILPTSLHTVTSAVVASKDLKRLRNKSLDRSDTPANAKRIRVASVPSIGSDNRAPERPDKQHRDDPGRAPAVAVFNPALATTIGVAAIAEQRGLLPYPTYAEHTHVDTPADVAATQPTHVEGTTHTATPLKGAELTIGVPALQRSSDDGYYTSEADAASSDVDMKPAPTVSDIDLDMVSAVPLSSSAPVSESDYEIVSSVPPRSDSSYGLLSCASSDIEDWQVARSPVDSVFSMPESSPAIGHQPIQSSNTLADSMSNSDSSESMSDSKETRRTTARDRRLGARAAKETGTSASAVASRRLRESMKDGTFRVNEAKFAKFERKILKLDASAEFDIGASWRVYHSACSSWVTCKEAYSFTRFRDHTKHCRGKKLDAKPRGRKGQPARDSNPSHTIPAATHTMDFYAKKLGWTSKADEDKLKLTDRSDRPDSESQVAVKVLGPESVPCGGITKFHAPKVVQYLARTGAHGGGARSTTVIAKELYGQLFGELNDARRLVVNRQQQQEQRWRNDHIRQAVFAVDCKRFIPRHLLKEGSVKNAICVCCIGVNDWNRLKTAFHVPAPNPEHYKFLNHQYRNENLGHLYARTAGLQDLLEGDNESDSPLDSPFVRFAVGVHQGKYDDHRVFLDMVLGMVEKESRDTRKVGMQNFNHGPALREFANVALVHSPELYRFFSHHLVLPNPRTIKSEQARIPRLSIDIDDRTFELAVNYTTSVHYNGPLSLSCDDTKLHATLRTYWDPEKQMHFVIGAVDGPKAVADAEELRELLSTMNDPKVKAVKIPLPNIPPLILAAKAIPDNLDAPTLCVHSRRLIMGLAERKIHVASYACDGTETERSVQRLITSQSPRRIVHTIKHPIEGMSDLTIAIPTYHGLPTVMIQDNKHGLKTARNNLYSGIRKISPSELASTLRHSQYYCKYL